MKKLDIYKKITDLIIAKLNEGVIPWVKPWSAASSIGNNASFIKKTAPYRGINAFTTAMCGYTSPYWMTVNQINQKGGTIKKGERGLPIVFWKFFTKDVEDDDGETRTKSFPMVRYYTVFNIEQTEGIKFSDEELGLKQEGQKLEFKPIERCEHIVKGYKDKPEIFHNGGQAFYSPMRDSITMPPVPTFKGEAEYYCTLFHEMAHSTGHDKRLGRLDMLKPAAFRSHKYSKEELVAEMTAAFLCADARIDNKTVDNSAAYIDSWRKVISDDVKLVVNAAQAAQKAADYILYGPAAEVKEINPPTNKDDIKIKDYGRSPEEVQAVAKEQWTTAEMQEEFTVHGFCAPFVEVTRKSDGVKGTLEFGHSPRVYFNFVANK